MSYVIEIEHHRPGPSGRSVLVTVDRRPYEQTHELVEHLVSIMAERGERFSGMEDWDLDTCRTWLTTALDQRDDIGDLCIGALGMGQRLHLGEAVTCGCGTPSAAYWYVEIIYGTNSETDYEYGYFCYAHKPRPSDLKPEGREHWVILERTVRRLPHATAPESSGTNPSAP